MSHLSRRNVLRKALAASTVAATGMMTASRAASVNQDRSPVNILDHGADPAASRGSSAAIQTAINTAASLRNGGAVYIPSGTYFIDQPVNLKSNVKLFGDGSGSVLACAFGAFGKVFTPKISPGGGMTPKLEHAPMFYNAESAGALSICDLQISGNSHACYGLWLFQNFYTRISNVLISQCRGRPYTNIWGQDIYHENAKFYCCDDGVLMFNCTGVTILNGDFEQLDGQYSFEWRTPVAGHLGEANGGLVINSSWFESSSKKKPSKAFFAAGGRSISSKCLIFCTPSEKNPPAALQLLVEDDKRVTDNIDMTCAPVTGSEFTQIIDQSPNKLISFVGKGTQGVTISGGIGEIVDASGVQTNNFTRWP